MFLRPMNRFRRLTGTIVAAMLLAVSCGGAACEASCNSEAVRPSCHEKQPVHAERAKAMPGMSDCGMTRSDEDRPVHGFYAHSECVHQVCKQVDAVVQGEKHLKAASKAFQSFSVVPTATTLFERPRQMRLARGNLPPPSRSISKLEMTRMLRV